MPSSIIISGGSASATGGGGGGSNASVGLTGAPAPTSATEIGIIVAGNLQGVSAANPLPISGSITATNPSVGLTGSPAPTSATEIGVIDNSGNLRGASSTNPVRIDPTGTTVQPVSGTIAATQSGTWTVGLSAGSALVGGVEIYDGGGVNKLAVNASGQIAISNFPATQTVSGTVTANIGTTGGITVAQSSTTLGESGPLVQGAVTTSPPVYTPGVTNPLSLDTSGNLRVSVLSIPANQTINLTQVNGSTVATSTAGLMKVGIVGGAAGGGIDAPVNTLQPGNALQVAGNDGTNLRVLATDGAGQVKVLVENSVAVTQSGTWTVGISALQTIAVTQATAANLNATVTGTVSINSIPAGTNTIGKVDILGNAGATLDAASTQNVAAPSAGLLVLGQFNTTPTTLTTGNVSPIQMDSAGNLLVNVKAGSSGNAAASATGSAVPASADYIGFNSGGNLVGVSSAAPLPVVGTGTAGSPGTAVLTVQGIASGTAIPASIAAGSGSVVNVRSTSSGSNPIDNQASTSFLQNSASSGTVPLYVGDSVYGGAFSGTANAALQGWSKMRTPTVFKTVSATASGNTAIWTPGTGNKFRLLKFIVDVTANASQTSGGVITISFQDATTAMNIAFDVFVPTTAVTTQEGGYTSGWVDLGAFGILSATANNALNVNLSAAFGTGNARVTVAGTEE